MASTNDTKNPESPVLERLVKVLVSIIVLVPVSVFIGYGGWIVLTLTAKIGGYDPVTEDGELLRHHLFEWPDRNREVMRTNGQADVPLKP